LLLLTLKGIACAMLVNKRFIKRLIENNSARAKFQF